MQSILIVDDDNMMGTVLREELSEMGYNTFYVDSVDGAFEFLKTGTIDVMLLDLKMPEKDGFELLKEFEGKVVPFRIIVLTAYADVQSAIRAKKMGAFDFLNKPYDFDELLIAIRNACQKDD